MIDHCRILKEAKTIAVVGFSKNPAKTSRQIASFLKSVGYNVVGVNPTISESVIEGIKIFKSLSEIDFQIDIVNVFRRSEDVDELVDEIFSLKPKVLWLQLGITSNLAKEKADKNGVIFVEDSCIYISYNNCF